VSMFGCINLIGIEIWGENTFNIGVETLLEHSGSTKLIGQITQLTLPSPKLTVASACIVVIFLSPE